MLDGLRRRGVLADDRIAGAMAAVDRAAFLPGVSTAEAYADEAVVTRRDDLGRAVSSASQPTMVALMLAQLGVRPGHRVLEIGAGTGWNAALLAHLVGSGGAVDTIDVDAAIAAEAEANLAGAGVRGVTVHIGDGWDGLPDRAPFDRVIATVGVWDLSPGWVRQLAVKGALVAPLWLRAGVQASIAFEPDGDGLRSTSVRGCGFMHLRGPHAGPYAYHSVRGWTVGTEPVSEAQPADQDVWQTLDRLLASRPLREPLARPLESGWAVRVALAEPAAVVAVPPDSKQPCYGVFLAQQQSLAVACGGSLWTFGRTAAADRLRRLLQGPPLDLDRLEVVAVPPGQDPPAGEWRLDRRDWCYALRPTGKGRSQ